MGKLFVALIFETLASVYTNVDEKMNSPCTHMNSTETE